MKKNNIGKYLFKMLKGLFRMLFLCIWQVILFLMFLLTCVLKFVLIIVKSPYWLVSSFFGNRVSVGGKKYNKKTIKKAVRHQVWNTYIGKHSGVDKCFVCQSDEITPFNFECGHVVSEKHGGAQTISNLKPICGGCNKSIGTENMNDFMRNHNFKKHKNWNKA